MKYRFMIIKDGIVNSIYADELEVSKTAESQIAILWAGGNIVAAIKEFDFILKFDEPETPQRDHEDR